MGSHNSQSEYSVLLSAPFLVTVGAIWAVSKVCSDCSTKANYPTPEIAGMVSIPVRVSGGPYCVSQCTSRAAAVAARLWSFQVTITVRTMLLTLGTSVGPSLRTHVR